MSENQVMSIYEAREYIENFDIWSDGVIQFKGARSYNGNTQYHFEVVTDGFGVVYFWYDDGDYSSNCEYAPKFYHIFSFVIDEQNLYVGDKIIPISNIRNILIEAKNSNGGL